MEVNLELRDQIFEIIENQLRDNNPPETKTTFNRLLKDGYDELNTKKMIGQCLAVELFDVMKNRKMFNEKRYVNNLKNLPKEPFD